MNSTTFERRVPPEPREVPSFRAELEQWLRTVGDIGQAVTSDVLLVATELVTNGVYHDGADLIGITVERRADEVVIEVTTVEHPPGWRPHYRDFTDPIEGGRGLAIVQVLAQGFSVVQRGKRRVSSCSIAAPFSQLEPSC